MPEELGTGATGGASWHEPSTNRHEEASHSEWCGHEGDVRHDDRGDQQRGTDRKAEEPDRGPFLAHLIGATGEEATLDRVDIERFLDLFHVRGELVLQL